jgi:phosphoribosylamine--glycine ligase
MRVLLVGNGSREHAIAWKLGQSPRVTELFVAPGNAGTAGIAQNVSIAATDIEKLLDFAQKHGIDFTVVGPEAPLAEGIVDRFQDAGLLIFGPTKAAARIESSKIFAKELMVAHGVPTGMAESFSSYDEARAYLQTCPVPVVVKADGLAAGKGVIVALTREEAMNALRQSMEQRQFGAAGERVLIEEFLEGQEVSVFAFVDGKYVSPMVAACDYKRAGDGNIGPNTGGMGSYSPPAPSAWNSEIEARVRAEILEPVAKALEDEGAPYRGVLYLGMILTKFGPKVIEFNCRLGDPEAQVVLPRLKTDLAEVMLATAQSKLEGFNIEWDSRACVGVVVASGGYPGSYTTGYPVSGLDELDEGIIVFHAGTKAVHQEGEPSPTIVTDGGRVLAVAAMGDTIADARRRVYDNVGRVHFHGAFFRKDIAVVCT